MSNVIRFNQSLPTAGMLEVGNSRAMVSPGAGQTFTLASRTDPFRRFRQLRYVPEGARIDDLVAQEIANPELHALAHVEVNGEVIPLAWWKRVRVKAGQCCTITLVPQDNENARLAAFVVVAIIAIIVTIYFPPAAGLTGNAALFAGAAAGAAVPIAGPMLVNVRQAP